MDYDSMRAIQKTKMTGSKFSEEDQGEGSIIWGEVNACHEVSETWQPTGACGA